MDSLLQMNNHAMPLSKDTKRTHRVFLNGGAELVRNDQVRFRLWAPEAKEVSVIFNDGKIVEMPRDDTGWFEVTTPCSAGTRYNYLIKNAPGQELKIPDPMSRAQMHGVHGESIVIDPEEYHWHTTDWAGRPWHESVIYEVHPGVMGGFTAIRQQLSSLAALGFTAIELMPIAAFPGDHNWGYDGVLLFSPQSSYGTPNELKSLIDDAHALGISVYLDVVYNHFGPDGNYLHAYAKSFFTDKTSTPWGAAIDYARPEVSEFFTQNALYWLEEYQFDGLRFDACHMIWDKPWLKSLCQKIKAAFPTRHIHLIAENFDNASSLLRDGFDAQWNDDGHHILHVLLTGESDGYYSDYEIEPAKKLARFLSEGFIYQGEASAYHENQPRGEWSQDLPPTSFVSFLQNHDQIGNRPFGERLISLTDNDSLRIATAILFLSPQIPMVFMGEEYGACQPFLYFTSHENHELVEAIRQGRKKEFSKFKGFNSEKSIPDPNSPDTFFASIPHPFSADDTSINNLSWYDWTAKLLDLRHEHLIPRLPDTYTIDSSTIGEGGCIVRWCLGDGTIFTLIVNLAKDDAAFEFQIAQTHKKILLEINEVQSALSKGVCPAKSLLALLEYKHG